MKILLVVFVANLIFLLIDIVCLVGVAFYLNLAVRKVRLFSGQHKTFCSIRGTPIAIGILPLGSCIEFLTPSDQPQAENAVFFEWLHPLEKILVILSGAIAIFALSSLILTPQRAIASILTGFEQILRGGFDTEYGEQLVAQIQYSLDREPLYVTLTILATKLLAFNLLPIPFFYGGAIVKELITLATKRPFVWPPLFVSIAIFFALLLAGQWAIVLVLASFSV